MTKLDEMFKDVKLQELLDRDSSKTLDVLLPDENKALATVDNKPDVIKPNQSLEPNTKEVITETAKALLEGIKIGYTISGVLFNGIYKLVSGFVHTAYFYGMLPTVYRKVTNIENIEKDYDPINPNVIGGIVGLVGGFSFQMVFLPPVIKEHPSYLLIPVATNVLSGLYEAQRYARKKLSEKNKGLLEERIDENKK